jgi:hypothetical protein
MIIEAGPKDRPPGDTDIEFWGVGPGEDGILPYWEIFNLPAPTWAKPPVKGGPGSGNFGHRGRPGFRGGSVAGGRGGGAALNAERTIGTLVNAAQGRTFGDFDFETIPDDYTDWNASLSPDERSAITYYVGAGYALINRRLRAEDTSNAKTNDRVRLLDAALARSEIPADGMLYRGITGRPFPEEPGAVFADLGFSSTSVNPGIADNFSQSARVNDPNNAGPVKDSQVMRIKVMKGQRGAYVSNLGMALEDEILLPRGSLFKVEAVTKDANRTIIDVIYLG